MGSSKNRTFRILQTLEARGYFRKDPETQAYQVGVTLMRLAHHVPRHFEFFSFVSPHLESLAQESQEVAHLLVRRGASCRLCGPSRERPEAPCLRPSGGDAAVARRSFA